MNWRTKLVLLFSKFRKPIEIGVDQNIAELREKASFSVRLGSALFDRKVAVKYIEDDVANGVPVRVYRNSAREQQRVIIYFHGGGFVLYGLQSHDLICRRLCAMNDCVVVSVDYRLAPEYTFPAAHTDAFTAIQWVYNNAAQFFGNNNDLVLMGDSAGGNLSACMAHRCRDAGIPIKAQVLIYPWIDGALNNSSIERNGNGYLLQKETVFWFRAQYTPRQEDRCHPHVSPCYETNFNGLPPAFVLTAEYDPLLDDGYKYYLQLQQNGVSVTYKEYKNVIHGFFNIPRIDAECMQAYKDIRSFLQTIN